MNKQIDYANAVHNAMEDDDALWLRVTQLCIYI